MKYKKSMIIIMLAIFLISIAAASASDVNDTAIASGYDSQIELSQSGEVETDNLQTGEEQIVTQTDNDENLSASNELDVLGVDEVSFTVLDDEISTGGNVELQHDYYIYRGSGSTINIYGDNRIIDGRGAVIDMAGSTIQTFNVVGSGITIKNLTIKNADYDGYGGAIYFINSGAVENCNFNNNHAEYDGGAIRMYSGTVTNCNFTDNNATNGGAVYFWSKGEVTNCNFIGNNATNGGALNMLSGSVTNSNFINNVANSIKHGGGAIYFYKNSEGNVTNCSFTDNSATKNGGAICFDEGSKGRTINCNFTDNKVTGDDSCGGAVYFNKNSEGNVTNCNFFNNAATGKDSWGGAIVMCYGSVSNCNFADNTATYYGGAVYFSGTGTVSNCNFTNNSATVNGGAVYFVDSGTVSNCNFTDNSAVNGGAINMGDGTVSNCNFTNNSATNDGGAIYIYSGTVSNCNFTDNSAVNGGAIRFSGSGNVTNCNFTGNTAIYGGAVYFQSTGTVANCNFTGNTVNDDGGAVFFSGTGTVANCNFTNNKATGDYSYGGAIRMSSGTVANCNFTNNKATGDYSYGGAIRMSSGSVSNCNFTGNNATTGSAIYFYKWDSSDTLTVSNSTFLNNRANAGALDIVKTENNITITFTGQNNLLNAIYSREDAEVAFYNVTYWGANGITTISSTMSESNKEEGQKITVGVVVNDRLVLSDVMVTNESGMIVLDIIAGENYYISARHDTDSYYTEAERTISNNTKFNVNVTSQTTNNKTVNITAKSNIPNEVIKGKLLFIVPNSNPIAATYGGNGTWWALYTFGGYGDYNVNASYIGLDGVIVRDATIKIGNAVPISVADMDIFVDEVANVVVVVPEAINGQNITVTVNGTSINVTVKRGNATARFAGLPAGEYVITASYAGDARNLANSTSAKLTVSRISTEISVENATVALFVGDSLSSGAALTPSGAGNLSYASSNSSVVKVDGGKIIAVGEGYAVITVSFAGDYKYAAAENKTIAVTVKRTDLKIEASADPIFIGENATITVTGLLDAEGKVSVRAGDGIYFSVIENGTAHVVVPGLIENTTAEVYYKGNAVYNNASINVLLVVNPKENATISIDAPPIVVGENATVTVILPRDAAGRVNIGNEVIDVVNGTASAVLTNLPAGNTTVVVAYSGDRKYNPIETEVNVTVNKIKTQLGASPLTAVYGINKYLVITLKDACGNALAGAKVAVSLNGVKYYTTNRNGQIKIPTKSLAPNRYSVKITFAGNDKYAKSTKTVKVTVRKLNSRLVVKSKAFRDVDKVKRYIVALKDIRGVAIRNSKVALRVGGVTYFAKTNSKGLAAFSLKLTKGKYNAIASFAGNKYYNKVAKKVQITVKVTFKTVSKGSSDKITVAKIQRALKQNGYYLRYAGHYLMVDGVYNDCTVRSVMQFQRANGLKVTGSVDYYTAKKLKII